MITTLLTGLLDIGSSFLVSKEKRKYLKEEGAQKIAEAEVKLKIAEMESQAQRLSQIDLADADYDTKAQLAKRFTILDEILGILTTGSLLAHFFYPAQMAAGWKAMGYSGAPWWYEFIVVGLFISTFGLMRLFRLWNPFAKGNKEK